MSYYGGMTEDEFVDEAKRDYHTRKILYDVRNLLSSRKKDLFKGEYDLILSLVNRDVPMKMKLDDYDFVYRVLSWDELQELRIRSNIAAEYIKDLMASIRSARERALKKMEGLKDGKEGRGKDGDSSGNTECE